MFIPATTLKASLFTMPKKDIRFYLNGAYLDFPKGRIVSTDGHCLFAGKIDSCDYPAVIVPRETIEAILKILGKRNEHFSVEVTVEAPDGQQPIVKLSAMGATVAASAIDGSYPEYERVIPRQTSGELAQFNPEILTACRDALNTYSHQKHWFAVEHNGPSGALMAGPDCLAIAMPMRMEPCHDLSWFDGRQELSEAA